MRRFIVLVFLTFVLHTYAKETPSSPEVQNAKLEDSILDRKSSAEPNQNSNLENSMLGKPGHLSNSPQLLGTSQSKLGAFHMRPVEPCKVMAQAVDDGFVRTRLHNLQRVPGKKEKKRIGRGHGSGHGGSCGRGQKGQKSRSGNKVRPGFEGGQTPMWRRLPKLRGIGTGMSAPKELWFPMDLNALQSYIDSGRIDPSEPITTKILRDKGIVARKYSGVKLLGDGELKDKVALQLELCSAEAFVKLEMGGHSLRIIEKEKVGPRINPR